MNPLATDVVFEPFGIPVTNTMLTGTLVTAVLAGLAVMLRLTLSIWPSPAQIVAEQMIDVWYALADNTGGKRARRFVPLVGSAFVFILFANWIGALPLKHIRTINPDGNSVELIRSATSDLNLTAAVALMVVVLVELLEMRSLGLKHYVKGLIVPNPLRWLEILVRPLSLAFRLFGSVFAGHVLVGTILAIAPVVLVPFLVLELFMGLIQAVIFATLSLVFLTIATARDSGHPQPADAAH
jgi:F-type H+-transporting ATPase subunit a